MVIEEEKAGYFSISIHTTLLQFQLRLHEDFVPLKLIPKYGKLHLQNFVLKVI